MLNKWYSIIEDNIIIELLLSPKIYNNNRNLLFIYINFFYKNK